MKEGMYLGRLLNAHPGSNDKGTPYIKFEMAVTHDIDATNNWRQIEQKTVNIKIYLSDAAMEYALPELEALGFNGDFVNPQFKDELYTQGAAIECRNEEYQGKTFDKWSWVGTRPKREEKAIPRDTLALLNARWRKDHPKTSAAPPVTTPPPAAPAAPTPPPIPAAPVLPEDDIPF